MIAIRIDVLIVISISFDCHLGCQLLVVPEQLVFKDLREQVARTDLAHPARDDKSAELGDEIGTTNRESKSEAPISDLLTQGMHAPRRMS